jgi:hypothetical protein
VITLGHVAPRGYVPAQAQVANVLAAQCSIGRAQRAERAAN